ncbi:MAG: RNA methyltransferase [Treponema sp.]|jgi:tRNA/rRNA methyltransferase/tRNA (cytidine32/uridine32-2'-O)-methyltransferase|nr:RNA methyltransferase [Treponema sp.]
MRLADIVIVLVRPEEPGNVGAVCRAMKNSGLAALRLVAPPALDDDVLCARAVHAVDVWEAARVFGTLEAAVADCSLVIGTTRRRGSRKPLTATPETLAAYLKNTAGRAALVFGNERTGLEADELALCNLASHIPSHDDFPSLNLSHAVQLYAYTLFRELDEQPAVKGAWVPLDQQRVNDLATRISDALASLGFYKQRGKEMQERFFRDVAARAGLSEREGAYLGNIFDKAAHLALKKPPTTPSAGE